jgi:hypothetical protein
VAADFTVGKVPDGQNADQIIIFGLAKRIFNNVPVNAGFHNFVGRPGVVISDDDVFAEALHMFFDLLRVFPETHFPTFFFQTEDQTVEFIGNMPFIAKFGIPLFNFARLLPIALPVFNLCLDNA